jgi:filamentous hemagglutinin
MLDKQRPEVKVAVHALVGGLVSRALGGEFAAGAAGAGAAELAMVTFGKDLLAIKDLSEGDRKALVQLVGMAISGVAAGAAGGSTAGVAAAVGTTQAAVRRTPTPRSARSSRASSIRTRKKTATSPYSTRPIRSSRSA